MLKSDAIEFFGGVAANVARALGITESAVSQWGEVVPESSAYKLESFTGGKLRVRREMYMKKSDGKAA